MSILGGVLDAVDRACSRFRPDSEIAALHAGHGQPVSVSSLLFQVIALARAVAEKSGGAVDPTVGSAIEALGYDRDFAEIHGRHETPYRAPEPVPGWWRIELDRRTRSVRIPQGLHLDLGACAKAFAADRAAARIASETGSGTLVSLGGDVAVAGPCPDGGWPVAIAVDSSRPVERGPVVTISEGGLASSSTAVRTWRRGGRRLHHIIDPASGDCASACWKLVSVAAASCVDANAASTAAIVWGEDAPSRLASLLLPSRLVRDDGVVVRVGGWPHDTAVADAESAAGTRSPVASLSQAGLRRTPCA
jgi:FAD:protein FMN transferase